MSMHHPALYRAEGVTASLLAGTPQSARSTVRLPSNVPYFVDNLWEYTRPTCMPSRRHAIYASPSRELARRNRSGQDRGDGFCVYRLQVHGEALIAQLKLRDAREHADLGMASRLVQSYAYNIAVVEPEERPFLALLFLPGATREDWTNARKHSSIAGKLMAEAIADTAFWLDASNTPDPASDGEFFVQLAAGSAYVAADLERYSA